MEWRRHELSRRAEERVKAIARREPRRQTLADAYMHVRRALGALADVPAPVNTDAIYRALYDAEDALTQVIHTDK
jgi:hypothetical protein